jgi:16S rRNA (cytosine1402-N4)-methyltransferase
MPESAFHHVSVLPVETISLLDPKPGETWVDATLGVGGHGLLIAERIGESGRLIGLDQDAGMLEIARSRLTGYPVTFVQANFDQLSTILTDQGISKVDGLLADLGFCSDQMHDPLRGLSFQEDGPLDMRLDREQGEPASELIARLDERDLANLIYQYAEERFSRRIAKRIVEHRKTSPISTTLELAEIVRRCVPRSGHIDPATRTFQALRIAVNDELGSLERLLSLLPKIIRPGGRAGLISFHSLEDRRVKSAFRDRETWEALTKKPVQASEEETRTNPRARSAKLRVAGRKSSESPKVL